MIDPVVFGFFAGFAFYVCLLLRRCARHLQSIEETERYWHDVHLEDRRKASKDELMATLQPGRKK